MNHQVLPNYYLNKCCIINGLDFIYQVSDI